MGTPTVGPPEGTSRVFNIDIETCVECGRTVKGIACTEDPEVINALLD